MSEYLAMGGYAAFVWPAYGVALVVLVGLVLASLRSLREREATVKALEGARPQRRRRPAASAAAPPAAEVTEI